MVYLLPSWLKRRQDKSVVSISEQIIGCLVVKVLDLWAWWASRVPSPHYLKKNPHKFTNLKLIYNFPCCYKRRTADRWSAEQYVLDPNFILSFFLFGFLGSLDARHLHATVHSSLSYDRCSQMDYDFRLIVLPVICYCRQRGGLTQWVKKKKKWICSSGCLQSLFFFIIILPAVIDDKEWAHIVPDETNHLG